MNVLLPLILTNEAYLSLLHRFQLYYEQRGATLFTSAWTCLLHILSFAIFKFESPSWQNVLNNHNYWYPHIFNYPRLTDSIRYPLQSLWLVMLYPKAYRLSQEHWTVKFQHILNNIFNPIRNLFHKVGGLFVRPDKAKGVSEIDKPFSRSEIFLLWFLVIISVLLAALCISQPFEFQSQLVFVIILWAIAMLIRHIPGRFPSMMMIVLSMTISCRYIWWRYTSTLNWHDSVSFVFGLVLLIAETYSWLILLIGYFQTIWPLNRPPVALPDDVNLWPDVDLLIPTYNEDLSIIKPTIFAALALDWPKEKLNIYILDDGKRPEFKAFAEQVGVNYIARPTNEHAKAGNINYTLKHHAKSKFVAIFDCDHIPTRSFLQLTMGWFLRDEKLAILQTPHHFFSPGPFEHNLGQFKKIPTEDTLFYGLIQDGNDTWNATFFCGSCAIIRRSALDEIGGIAVETVTEDAHTSLKLQRKGYNSAYTRIPLAAGLSTDSLSAHINQRIRWARGMVQIFRLDNPLLGKGLKLSQRLCYANSMLYFLSGIPRIIFLLAPLAYLLLQTYVIFAPGIMILIYVLPHMIHASLTNSRIQGKYRHSFWGEIYETVLSWYIAKPTTVALINPKIGKFNVTVKGASTEKTHFDRVISMPYLILIMLNFLALFMGLWRLFTGPNNEEITILLNLIWVVYNLLILGGAIAVAIEARQIRRSPRIDISMPAAIATSTGHIYYGILKDYSDSGVSIELPDVSIFNIGEHVTLILKQGIQEFTFPINIVRIAGNRAGAQLNNLSTQEYINFVQCTFARVNTWSVWQNSFEQDKPLVGLKEVLSLGFRGYKNLANFTPPFFRIFFKSITSTISWIVSLLPHEAGSNVTQKSPNSTLA